MSKIPSGLTYSLYTKMYVTFIIQLYLTLVKEYYVSDILTFIFWVDLVLSFLITFQYACFIYFIFALHFSFSLSLTAT